ncbi:MAG: peptidylprolyl isomerase [Kistimonas sp.]|nr:peptidylprolyl isomerase [Kistimonas sp.]
MSVILRTSFGPVTLELDAEKAPATVANFLHYVRSGHYDDTLFHRVIDNFMIQGGGMDASMQEKNAHPKKDPVINEADNGLKNDRGSVAMARTSDPHSATAQFFINVADNDFLNHTAKTLQGWGYAVFGRVVEGMDVVDKIRRVQTGSRGMHADVPVENVLIESAVVQE